MRKALVCGIALPVLLGLAFGQTSAGTASSGRKVVLRVAPNCPELARKMHIQGIVKVEAIVRANGTVKATKILGGNPVLADAAVDAVTKWKFEPGSSETSEVLQLTFVPQ